MKWLWQSFPVIDITSDEIVPYDQRCSKHSREPMFENICDICYENNE